MTVERPTSGTCAQTLADGTVCGVPFEVKRMGNIPKYCVEHRNQKLRQQLDLAWARRKRALAEDGSPAAAAGDEQELEADVGLPSDQDDDRRVCRASSCSIPLTDEWVNEFCPAHWRVLGPEARSELVGSRGDEQLHETAVLRAFKVINSYEGRAQYQSA